MDDIENLFLSIGQYGQYYNIRRVYYNIISIGGYRDIFLSIGQYGENREIWKNIFFYCFG